jgi:RimJ/RimL family protein N-acetyltransferase
MADQDFAQRLSPRLVLRRFKQGDLAEFCRYRADPEVARYQSWDGFTEADGERFLSEQCSLHPGQPGTWFQFAIELRSTGELVGDCAWHCLKEDPGQAEIGFTLASAHRGRGYATEAVACLLDYLFVDLKLHRAVARIDTRNPPALAVVQRLGMRREGHFVESAWFKAEWTSEYVYAILHREWVSRKP